MDSGNTNYKSPSVLIIANSNIFTNAVVKKFIEMDCSVDVITYDNNNSNFGFTGSLPDSMTVWPIQKYSHSKLFDYVLFIDLDQFEINLENQRPSGLIQEIIDKNSTKIVCIFSYVTTQNIQNENSLLVENIVKNSNCKVRTLYLGDVVDKKMGFVNNTIVERILSKDITNNYVEWKLFPVELDDAIRFTQKAALSFIGESISQAVVSIKDVKEELVTDFEAVENTEEICVLPPVDEKIFTNFDINVLRVFVKEYRNLQEEKVLRNRSHNYKTYVSSPEESRGQGTVLVTPETKNDINDDEKESVNFIEPENRKVIENVILIDDRGDVNDLPADVKNNHTTLFNRLQINKREKKPKPIKKPKANLLKKLHFSPISINTSYKKGLVKSVGFLSLVISFIFILIPIILIAVSAFAVGFNKNRIVSYDLKNAQMGIKISKNVVNISESYFFTLSKVPLVGRVYIEPHELSLILYRVHLVEEKIVISLFEINSLVNTVLGEGEENVDERSKSISLNTASLNDELGFLEGQLKTLTGIKKKIVVNLISPVDITNVKSSVLFVEQLSKALPDMLGKGSSKTYAIVFQDENTIRPTGGIAKYFALIDFKEGRLTGFNVYTPDFIDKQIKGEVAPPANLLQGLNTDVWSSSDFNWSLNFESSADQLNWFFSKSINAPIDGVVFVSGDTLEHFETGIFNEKLAFSDLQKAIYQDSPDTKPIKEYISKISQMILEMDDNKKVSFYSLVSQNINNKNLQIVTLGLDSDETFQNTNLTGKATAVPCNFNCNSEVLGIFESSIYANSQEVERSVFLAVFVEEGMVKHSMQYTIKNLKKIDSIPYQSYTRILVNKDSGFDNVYSIKQGNTDNIESEITVENEGKAAGFKMEVNSGEEVTYLISWETKSTLDLSRNGEYNLRFVKQPGLKNIPVSMRFSLPKNLKVYPSQVVVLTDEGVYGYNTTLERDVILKLNLNHE